MQNLPRSLVDGLWVGVAITHNIFILIAQSRLPPYPLPTLLGDTIASRRRHRVREPVAGVRVEVGV